MASTHLPQPLPDVNNVVFVKFSGTVGGQAWVNTLHYQHDEAVPSVADLTTMGNALNTSWGTNMSPVQTNVTILTQIQLISLKTRTGNQAVITTPTRTGAQTSAAANNVSYAVGFIIARRYRGGHPRVYHAGMYTTAMNDPSTLTTTAKNAILAAWSSIKGTIETQTLTTMPNPKLCNVSYFHGKNTDGTPALRPVPVVDIISGVKGDLRVDSQRHRLGRPR